MDADYAFGSFEGRCVPDLLVRFFLGANKKAASNAKTALKTGSASWNNIANSYGRPRLKCGICWTQWVTSGNTPDNLFENGFAVEMNSRKQRLRPGEKTPSVRLKPETLAEA